MSLRVLVAPQQFKGTLSARAAAEAVARGLRSVLPDVVIDLAPLADGGAGTVDALVLSRADGQDRLCVVEGPLSRPVLARWGYLPDRGTGSDGILEMAAANGLTLVPEHRRAVLDAHTTGTGQMIAAALEAGCARITVGAGDSATCDGGVGAATALGIRFLDAKGEVLAHGPRHLRALEHIDLSGADPRLKKVSLQVLTDVRNPLLGDEGAARVYAPQKGADPDAVELLESSLEHLTRIVHRELGTRLESEAGAGAAGGLAFGLAALCGAQLKRGFDVVSDAMGLFSRVSTADVILTGEGQIDAQTPFAKGPWSLGRLARMQKKRVVAFAGAVSGPATATRDAFDEIIAVTPHGEGMPDPLHAAALLEAAARKWALGQRHP